MGKKGMNLLLTFKSEMQKTAGCNTVVAGCGAIVTSAGVPSPSPW